MYNINRPISPHLTVYNAQKSSVSSIWHRISGAIMFNLIISPTFLLNFFIFVPHSSILINFASNCLVLDWILPGFLSIIYVIFLYHISNGVRHLLWDSVMHVNTNKMSKDSNSLLIFVLGTVLLKFLTEY
uniref:Succinate:cytochrome c oxidoreductase subunit 3 n=1 Tax=Bangia fuscopurpurea TaxID=101920 RepID=A0A0E3M6M5_BANFU|nr:succinate:cytochrome c oxidoreductase subunit 3 [Bangia fuscopurpurea]AKA66479.1 succinate:cytochrome c oxidoreductase subunit 3 [Bangia fuscopurpurea]